MTKPVKRGIRPGRPLWWSAAFALLLVPAVAMQLTRQVNWSPGDFAVAALLIGVTGLAIEAALRLLRLHRARWLVVGGILTAALLVWAELSVGIFD